ncbi:MAG: pyridoxamine 5'-phosphate oxidase family protein [Pseudomonadota bacterium]
MSETSSPTPEFYTPAQERAQALVGETGLAEAALKFNVRPHLNDRQTALIEKASWFVLSTVDAFGFPAASIKAGSVGFVAFETPTRLVFHLERGNGMCLTLGNLLENQGANKACMYFMNDETGEKLRLRGYARIDKIGETHDLWPVRFDIEFAWDNCPRFKDQILAKRTRNYDTRFPLWKRLEFLGPFLSDEDQAAVAKLGAISHAEWVEHLDKGEGGHES